MADYIYNDFSSEQNDDVQDTPSSETTKQRNYNNIILIVVCAFFALVLLLMTVFGIIIAGKLSSSGTPNDDKNLGSLIFISSPENEASSEEESQAPQSPTKPYESYSQVIYKVKDSVVEIKTSFYVNSTLVSSSAGSGVIIGSNVVDDTLVGYPIVTNAHVIQDGNGNISTNIIVKTTDGKEYTATVHAYDSYGDIALLLIKTTDTLTRAEFGNSAGLSLGQEVIAIGNTLGTLGGTATNGIISALDREIEIDGNYFNLLQTNAAINSGNSGGGLFDMHGKLVGIINAKTAGVGVEGIGFAIPSNDAKDIVSQLWKYGYVADRPYIGVTASIVSDRYSSYVYVHDLAKNYNDNVLQIQDIILSMNGVDINSLDDFRAVVSRTKPKDIIEAQIKRGNEFLTVEIVVYSKNPS